MAYLIKSTGSKESKITLYWNGEDSKIRDYKEISANCEENANDFSFYLQSKGPDIKANM